MTREEARQIIATWLVSSKGVKGQRGYIEGWFDEEDVEAFRMAIEALSTEAVQGWIPVSERLPEKNGCYLVSTTGANNYIIDIAYYIEGMWHKASRIKAWMPLPKPYREDGEACTE